MGDKAAWFRVQGSGFRVQGSGFTVQGSRFGVQGSGSIVGARLASPLAFSKSVTEQL
jgi:hypothetical protein